MSRVSPDISQTAYIRIGSNLEHEAAERLGSCRLEVNLCIGIEVGGFGVADVKR